MLWGLGLWTWVSGFTPGGAGGVEERAGLEGTSSYPASSVGLLGPRDLHNSGPPPDGPADTGVLLCFLRPFYGENVK